MSSDLRNNVSIIIPAWNEEATISSVVESCLLHGEEVLVIDGHSMDRTRDLAVDAGARVVSDHGRGKGDAVQTGIEEARHDILIFIDADGSHNAGDIPRMVEPLRNGDAEMTLASRMLGGSDELHGNWTNFIRMVGAGLLTLLLNLRWKTILTDTLNGFRGIRKDIAQQAGLKCDGFEIELEMITKVLRGGGRILEVPSHEFERKGGQSKIPTYKGFIVFFRGILWIL